MQDRIELRANGKVYDFGKEVVINRSLDAISSSFSLTLTQDPKKTSFDFKPGDSCQVLMGDESLVSGYIDSKSIQFDAYSRSLTVQGRDRTGQLVDCSALRNPPTWQNVKFEKIASDLIKSFSIQIHIEADTGSTFAAWHIEPGETVFECLERAARLRGLILIPNGKGELVVTKPKRAAVTFQLKEGENILSASLLEDVKQCYSEYRIQSHVSGNLAYQTETASIITARANDSLEKRHRPLVVSAEGVGNSSSAKKRAEWERQVRRARSKKIEVIVSGWHVNEKPWSLGNQVALNSPSLEVNSTFIISSLRFELSEQGRKTFLQLEDADAYSLDPTLKYQENPLLSLIQREN